MSIREARPHIYDTLDLWQDAGTGEESIPTREWNEVMAESWSRLQSCCIVIEELARHPASAPADLVSYELALSSVYVAIVALEACEQQDLRSRWRRGGPRRMGE